MYLGKHWKWATFLLASAFTTGAVAQDAVITIGDVSGPAGATVEVEYSITFAVDSRSYNFDVVTSDLTLLDGGSAGIDVSRCLENAGSEGDFISDCVVRTAPNDDTVRLGQTNNTDPISDLEPIGVVEYTIDPGATPGDVIDLTVQGIAIENVDNADVTVNDGSITVVDVTAELNVQPPSINFPATETGTSAASEVVTISNDGSDGIDMEVSDVSLATGTHFSVSDVNCGATPFTLSDGESCDVEVTFSPTAIGSFNDSLDVTSDAGTVINDSVALSGEGTAGPAATLDVSPASHDFQDILTGESDTFTFTVSNTGDSGSSLDIDAIALGGGTDFSISGGSCSVGDTLADGDSCTVDVEFAPAADGAQNDTLTVDGTDTINSTSVQGSSTVDGEGVSEARFSSNPATGAVSLGTTAPGATLNSQVTVTNNGNENLTVDSCTLDDPDGVFTMTPDAGSLAFDIAPDASDSFEVSCSVPEVSSYSASLTCATNDADNAEVTYDFTCTGQPLVIPTMQNWGLILLTLMMLMVGGLSIRYFRA